jgi:hypothetical protein
MLAAFCTHASPQWPLLVLLQQAGSAVQTALKALTKLASVPVGAGEVSGAPGTHQEWVHGAAVPTAGMRSAERTTVENDIPCTRRMIPSFFPNGSSKSAQVL